MKNDSIDILAFTVQAMIAFHFIKVADAVRDPLLLLQSPHAIRGANVGNVSVAKEQSCLEDTRDGF